MYQGILPSISGFMAAAQAGGTYVSRCTIQRPAVSASGEPLVDDSGAPSGAYTDVPGLIDMQCQDAPEGFGGGIQATEIKGSAETTSMAFRHVALACYFPQLDTKQNWGDIGWRAVVTNPYGVATIYDLLGAEADSQRSQIRLRVRKVTT